MAVTQILLDNNMNIIMTETFPLMKTSVAFARVHEICFSFFQCTLCLLLFGSDAIFYFPMSTVNSKAE